MNIASVPPEILEEIFLDVQANATKHIATALLLSHVSKRWRGITFHLSKLWTALNISHWRLHPLLGDILTRSNGRLLDMRLILPGPLPTEATMAMWRTLVLLCPEIERCWRLEVVAPKAVYRLVWKIIGYRCSAPQLRYLVLQCVDSQDSAMAWPINKYNHLTLIVTFHANLLTHVVLDGIQVLPSTLQYAKTLHVKNLDSHWLQELLPSENVLEYLSLSNVACLPEYNYWGEREVVTEHLAHITLHRQNPGEFFERTWRTGALTSLTISEPSMLDWICLNKFLFLQDQHPQYRDKLSSLTKLTLAHCDTRAMMVTCGLNPLILATPQLVYLEFENSCPEPFLEAHETYGGWPHLEVVSVDGCGVTYNHRAGALWLFERARREKLGV